ncbi:glutamine synthetase family protein [Mycobacterium sp. 29Ha]|uniref:glutamine synthetase family protein n=1 Tax=Mycobacterium sp. 29Ha TaxID=2939268 RepID=UPI00293933DC|nr:glutamine synthetase family protein [Mycobacterium sp. 29Ha]MDV3130853.1 glutamine synthetase family protein [Mycobacterium sp. 29Ha]
MIRSAMRRANGFRRRSSSTAALGSGFAFCEASLGWNTEGAVVDSLDLTNWIGGYPDVFAVPDLATYRPLPWRPRVGHVISDIVSHDRSPSLLDPRAVLRKVLARLGSLGYTAKIGVEFELYLLNTDGSPFQDDIHAYSLENANALDPLLTDLYETLSVFTRLEGIQTEYGPGQIETNLVYTDALEAADDAVRLKYAAKEVARKHGKLATFMPKPFTERSGSSQHLHISLWRDGEPAFAPNDGAESQTALHAIAGLLEHLPSITLFGAHSVNAYRRFVPDSFAPATVTWSRDNRSAAVRSLVETNPSATRIELRSGASDANPYWLIASALAAVIAGLEAKSNPPPAEGGNLYIKGVPLPESLGVALELATRDDTIADILGADSVRDFAALARSEWVEYSNEVSDWERERYLTRS